MASYLIFVLNLRERMGVGSVVQVMVSNSINPPVPQPLPYIGMGMMHVPLSSEAGVIL